MPKLQEPIVIASGYSFLPGRQPYGQHWFVGGNYYMLKLLRNNIDALDLTANATHFNTVLARTEQQLLNETAQMQIIQGIVAFCKRGHIQANDISSHHGLEGSSTAKLVKALQDTGLELFVRPMFMELGSLPVPISGVTVIEWGCIMPGCSDRVE